MYDKIRAVLNTSTVRQSSITTISTFASAGLGAVFYLVLARVLGTAEYGLFTICLTILVTVVTVADVGMGQGIIRFIGEHRDSPKYLGFASFALRTKLTLAIICWLAFYVFSGQIAQILGQPSLQSVLPTVGFGVFSYILVTYSFSMLQSLQKFVTWGGLQVGSNLIRLLVLWGLSFYMPIDTHLALEVFAITSLVGFFLSWFWLDPKIIFTATNKSHISQFWSFNKWAASFSMLSSLVSRLDIFLASRYLNLSTVGTYSLAVTMVSFLPQLSVAIGAVTSAKFANKSDPKDAISYLRKSTVFSSLTGLSVSALMIPVAFVVVGFAGRDYSASMAPFFILLASQIIFMMGNPLRDYILYFLRSPKVFFWTALLQGIVISVFGIILIPSLGVMGSATAVLAGQISLGLACFIYQRYQSSK